MGSTSPRSVVLDAGALIEFDRGNPRMRALVRLVAMQASRVVVPSPVLAQAWRDGSRQARLAALIGSDATLVEVMDEALAKGAGVLCGRSHTSDIVDAAVVLVGRAHGGVIVTTDPSDLRRIDPKADLENL